MFFQWSQFLSDKVSVKGCASKKSGRQLDKRASWFTIYGLKAGGASGFRGVSRTALPGSGAVFPISDSDVDTTIMMTYRI
ncbi:hypothetical protein B2D07_19905 [Desulfococcus multivorans]|nr:uncharacterized protein Dmul_21070 [Desulfococcus multivorans]AQX36463.1 hypothetical protein B2D07_19905 [Desulfococcus multivorans]